jgi:hypothetical protein
VLSLTVLSSRHVDAPVARPRLSTEVELLPERLLVLHPPLALSQLEELLLSSST